jgi:pantothenate kinase-related protein Tda10
MLKFLSSIFELVSFKSLSHVDPKSGDTGKNVCSNQIQDHRHHNKSQQDLNSDQKFAFDIVLKWIHNYIENPDEFEPLRMIVSSTAGSGKSFLIKW